MFAKSPGRTNLIHLSLLAAAVGLGLLLVPSVSVPLLLTTVLIDLIFYCWLRTWKPEILRLNRSIRPSLIFAYSALILLGPIFILVHLFVIALGDGQRQSQYRRLDQGHGPKTFFPAIGWLVGASLIVPFLGLGIFSDVLRLFAFGLLAVGGIMTNDLVVALLFRWGLKSQGLRTPTEAFGDFCGWVARYISASFGVVLICSVYSWDGYLGLVAIAILIASISLVSLSVSQGVNGAIAAAAEAVNDEMVHSESLGQEADRIEALAYIDALTGLPNRRRFEADLDDLPNDGIIALGDVSGLKAINDRRGHPVGDDLLRAIARALAEGADESGGRAYRFTGGDEYAILYPRIEPEAARFLPLRLDALIAHQISTFPSLDGSRAHLRLGWSRRTAHEAPAQTRRAAEMMLTECGINERSLRLVG